LNLRLQPVAMDGISRESVSTRMDQTPIFTNILRHLAKECENSKTFRELIETLLAVNRKIVEKPGEVQFRSLNLMSRRMFQMMKYENAIKFMELSGWRKGKDRWQLRDTNNLDDAITALIQFRSLAPDPSEWVEETKIESNYAMEQAKKEETARAEAAAERYKELENFYKEKKEKERIAELVKQEHQSDMIRRQALNRSGGGGHATYAQAPETQTTTATATNKYRTITSSSRKTSRLGFGFVKISPIASISSLEESCPTRGG
jgi:hypothetical protein